MTTVVRRTAYRHGRQRGLATLEQTFRFEGTAASGAAITNLLLTAPLIGSGSIFGNRPGREGAGDGDSRTLHGFSPVPGFRFDVELRKTDRGMLTVRFSQPDRKTPYLHGGLLWLITEADGDGVFEEQINTERALQQVGEPLHGPRPSLRRWLFFRAGHKQVMRGAMKSLAALLDAGNRA